MRAGTVLKYLWLITWSVFLFTGRVHAYIDPSVATYAIQAIAGIAITLGTVLGVYWRRISKRFRGKQRTAVNTTESDLLTFHDPVSGEEIKSIRKTAEPAAQAEQTIKVIRAGKAPEVYSFRDFLKNMLYALPIIAAVAFMIGVYAPLEIYMNNQIEFWFDYSFLRPVVLYLFAAIICAGTALYAFCYFIHKKLFKAMLAIGLIAFLILYIQGNFLVAHLPAMDGSEWKAVKYLTDTYISIILTLCSALITLILMRSFNEKTYHRISSFICLVVSLMLGISLISISLKKKGTAKKEFQVVTTENEFTYSEDTNFIILMLDTVNGEYAAKVLAQEEYGNMMEDFTFFDDTMGVYTNTNRAVPYILTGDWYENDEDFITYYKNASAASPLFASLTEKGYEMNLYESHEFFDWDYSRYKNILLERPHVNSNYQFCKLELKLVLFKYLPYYLKPFIIPDTTEFKDLEETEKTIFKWHDPRFYSEIQKTEIQTVKPKQFKFIHLEGSHTPWNLDENVNRVEDGTSTYEAEVKAQIRLAHVYCESLKKAGVYDNSVIIVMSDHGHDEPGHSQLNRHNPMLLIKGIGEKHPLEISKDVVSYEDLQEAYRRLLAGKRASELFDYHEGAERKRRFLQYNHKEEYHMEEYYQVGYAKNWDTMIPSGVVYDLKEGK